MTTNTPPESQQEKAFAALRAWRTQTAMAKQVPPYIIATDAALRAIARDNPTTIAELATARGFGQSKADTYGADILRVLAGARCGCLCHDTKADDDDLVCCPCWAGVLPDTGHAGAPFARPSRVVVPVHYSAWLNGDLGQSIEKTLAAILAANGQLSVRDARMSRLPRALLVESAAMDAGNLVTACAAAASRLEADVATAYPIFHAQLGPIWTGTLQAVFTQEA